MNRLSTYLGKFAAGGQVIISEGDAYNLFIAKFDNTGQIIWLRQANSTLGISPTAAGADSSGNLLVTGNFTGTASFGLSTINSGNSAANVFLAKYGVTGDLQWLRQAGGASIAATGLALDENL